jgi:glyoxylase-like metal-dependent hydrolase (beta-lactamase superfamily II)
MLRIKSFTFNPFQENTFVVSDETNECIIVDPGCYEKSEGDALIGYIKQESLKVTAIINTHCHIDHVLGNYRMKETFRVKLIINRIEEPFLRAVKSYAPNYGFNLYQESTPDEFIDEKDFVNVGNQKLEVLFLPGHSPGHIALYHEKEKIILAGDVLFRSSIGRTDLPGGDHDTLIRSIQHNLFQLPDDVTIYCGHGPETTIGYEKKTNPYCSIEN